ncbi:MAG: MATE family efflux transporter [Gammaproteobacteria bacterium]
MKILQKKFYIDDVSPLLILAIPLIFSGVVESSIGFFSTIFLARLGHEALAAGGLVNWLFATLLVILWGTLTAVSVMVAQKHGAKDEKGVAYVLRDGIVLALLLLVPAFLLLWNISPVLLLAGQSPEIVILARSYLHGLAWGLLPDFIMLVLLQFVIGLGHARTSMTFILFKVPVAIFCIYCLIFGKFGLPRLDIAGIGWGLTVSYWITTIWLAVYLLLNNTYKQYLKNAFTWGRLIYLKDLLQTGVPMGAMYCIEIGFFLALTLVMGVINSASLAANQIAMQYLGQLIAVVFSIAQAVTVRMGHKLGANDLQSAQRTNDAGIFLAFSFMFIVALCFWMLPEKLISIDLNVSDASNTQVVLYAKQFLAVSALFQLFEAVRITLFGSLRALKDTHFTLFSSIISFWCIALPLGYLLAIPLKWGGTGLWWGMVVGVICSVVMLSMRFKLKMRRCFLFYNSKQMSS